MASWLRNGVMVVVMGVWTIYILVTLIRGDEIETLIWGIPGAVYLSMNPTFKRTPEEEPKKVKDT